MKRSESFNTFNKFQHSSSRNVAITNPIKQDPELKALVDELGGIKKEEAFARWRESFLDKYENYLDRDSIARARAADDRMLAKMKSFAKPVMTAQKCIASGDIDSHRCNVRGQNALNELSESTAASKYFLCDIYLYMTREGIHP